MVTAKRIADLSGTSLTTQTLPETIDALPNEVRKISVMESAAAAITGDSPTEYDTAMKA